MSFFVTHRKTVPNGSGGSTVYELLQIRSSQPTIVNLPIIDNSESIRQKFDNSGMSPLTQSYRMAVVNGNPEDFFSIFNEAEPQSVMLRITVNNFVLFRGFLEPKTISKERDKDGFITAVEGEFFNGATSLNTVNVTNELIEELAGYVGTNKDTPISYDRLMQGIAKNAEQLGTKISYYFPWGNETWRQFSSEPPTWNMFLDMAFRFKMYREWDDESGDYSGEGERVGDILMNICRTFNLRMGYSYSKGCYCVYDITLGADGQAGTVQDVGNGIDFGFFPRIGQVTQVRLPLQVMSENLVLDSPKPLIKGNPPLASITIEAPNFRPLLNPRAGVGKSFTLPNLKSTSSYLSKGYSYTDVKLESDSEAGLADDFGNGLVVYSDPPNALLNRFGYFTHPVLEAEWDVPFPAHVVSAWVLGSWRFDKRDTVKGVYRGILDPMVPVVFDGKTYLLLTCDIDPDRVETSFEMIELASNGEGQVFLRTSVQSIDFGNVDAFSQTVQFFDLTGQDLTSDFVTVTAPEDFKVGTDPNGLFSQSVQIPVSNGTVNQRIYVKFTPKQTKAYIANIEITAQSGVRTVVRVLGSNSQTILRTATLRGFIDQLEVNPISEPIFRTGDSLVVVNRGSGLPYTFRIRQDQLAGDDVLYVERTYVNEGLFVGSIVEKTDQILSSFIQKTDLAIAIGVSTNRIGEVLEQIDGELVTEIDVQMSARLVKGNDYEIISTDPETLLPITTSFRPTEDFEGVGTVQIEPQVVNCNVGDMVIIAGTTLATYTQWRPDRIISNVEKDRATNAIGVLLNERLRGFNYTTLIVSAVDGQEQFFKNNQVLTVYYLSRDPLTPDALIYDTVVIDGNQSHIPSGPNNSITLDIISWNPASDFYPIDPNTGYPNNIKVAELGSKTWSRITQTDNRVDITVQEISDVDFNLAQLTLEVGNIEVDLSDLEGVVTTLEGEVADLDTALGTIGARVVLGVQSGSNVTTFELLAGTNAGAAVLRTDIFVVRNPDSSVVFDNSGITVTGDSTSGTLVLNGSGFSVSREIGGDVFYYGLRYNSASFGVNSNQWAFYGIDDTLGGGWVRLSDASGVQRIDISGRTGIISATGTPSANSHLVTRLYGDGRWTQPSGNYSITGLWDFDNDVEFNAEVTFNNGFFSTDNCFVPTSGSISATQVMNRAMSDNRYVPLSGGATIVGASDTYDFGATRVEVANDGAANAPVSNTRGNSIYLRVANVAQSVAGVKHFTGTMRANAIRTADNSLGMTDSRQWTDATGETHVVTMKQGIITSWTVS